MLPDVRVVIFAVIVTFLFTAGVGFYTSARLFSDQQPNTRQEAMAPRDTAPVNRVSVTAPEAAAPVAAPEPAAAETRPAEQNAETEQAEVSPQAEPAPSETSEAEAPTPEDAPAKAEETTEPAAKPSVTTDAAPATEPSATQAARFLLITPALNPSPLVAGLRRAAHGAEDVVAPPPFPPRGPATAALMVPARTRDMLNAGRLVGDGQQASATEATEDDADDELTGTVTLPTGPIPLPRARPARSTHSGKSPAVTRKSARQSKPKPRRARPLIVRPAPAQSSSTFSFPFSLSNSSSNQTTTTSSVPAAPAAPFTQSR